MLKSSIRKEGIMQDIYRESVPTRSESALHASLVTRINELKYRLGTVILAHTYQTPEIYHSVADIRGDSLALAREAARVDAGTMIICGVHFMAETAKLLNPGKKVLIPDPSAGCSLAESITAEDVRALKARYPGVPVVSYVNTSAEVKAETDICCTSANAVEVVESLRVRRVIFLPDRHLAAWVASRTDVEMIRWKGCCEVHDQIPNDLIVSARRDLLPVLAHPECPMRILEDADVVASTSGMRAWVREHRPKGALLMTESSLADNLAVEMPEIEFRRPEAVCAHMKKITLEGILECLEGRGFEVEIDGGIAARARRSIDRMLEVGR